MSEPEPVKDIPAVDADVLILGAGMGGMCAAARLAAAGCKVAVLEKTGYLGGRCSHRERDGFIVTTGAIMIPMGPDSAIRQAFDGLGVGMNMVETTGRMRYRLAHGDYDLPPTGGGLKGMLEFACQDDPAEAAALMQEFVAALGANRPDENEMFLEWLGNRTSSKAVQGLFQGFCAALMGTSLGEIPAAEFFRFLGSSSKGSRFGLASQGNGGLMEDLGAAIEQRGGQILRHCAVDSILVEKGAVRGVTFRDRGGNIRQLLAHGVISNLGPVKTIKLTGDEKLFEGPYRQQLDAAPHPAPIIHYAFVLDEPLIEGFAGSLVFGNTRNLIYLEIPTNISPEYGPPGKALHTVYGAPADATVSDLKPEAAHTLVELEEQFPGVMDRARFIVRARHSGPSPGMHRWPGYMMPVTTPVKNLYNAGDGATPPGTIGTEGAAASARDAVAHFLAGSHEFTEHPVD